MTPEPSTGEVRPQRRLRAGWYLWLTLGVALAALVVLVTSEGGAILLSAALQDGSGPVPVQDLAGAQAIVVPGGNRDRVHEAARLHRASGLPILLAGRGTGDAPYEAESEKMAWMLRTQYGIEARWVETRSVHTYDNAVESWCLLSPHGIRRIVLVTHADHMVRAHSAFAVTGFSVVRAPLPVPPEPRLAAADFVPSRRGVRAGARALFGWAGVVAPVVERLLERGPECHRGALP